jgi:hypothetical protein
MPKCAAWRAGAFGPYWGIDSMLYERRALSRKSEELARKELAFQGRNSAMRLMGCLAMRLRTWRRYVSGRGR